MGRTRAIIEVTPSRLEVACVRAGHVVAAKAVRHDAAAWVDAWPGALLALDTSLGSLVNELGLAGVDTTILVASPTAASGVFSCGAAAGAAGAEAAARLSLGNVCGFDLIGNPCEVAPVSRDTEGGPESRQAHALAYAERDRSVAAVVAWAERAGLRVEGILPIEVPILRAAIDAAAQQPADQSAAVVLWMGEHSSVLAAGNAGRLRFVRTIAVGAESFVEALTRPMSPRSTAAPAGPAEPVTLTKAQARALLWRIGVPQRDQIIDPDRALDGAAALPLLQPVLQRLSVEAKQSLRFGLSEEERAVAVIRLIGPGAAVSGLAAALSLQSGLTVTSGQAIDCEPVSSERGPISSYLACASPPAALMPVVAVEGRERSRTRRWLHTGVALAAAIVAGDAVMTRVELRKEQQRLANAAGLSRAVFDAQQAITDAQQELASLETRVNRASASAPAWGPTLVMLANLAPEPVRLTSLKLGGESPSPAVSLKGFATASDATEATRAVKAYIDALEALPLVSAVSLAGTERGTFEGRTEQRFEIKAQLVRTAAASATASAGLAKEDAQ